MHVCIDENAYWEGIAACRRKMHGISKHHLLVVDQTGVKGSMRVNYSLAPANSPAPITIRKTASYSPRYDVMGSLLVDRTLPVDILTPTYKTEAGIRGYTKELLLGYFTNTVAPELIAMNRQHIVVCMDRGLAPTKQQVIDAFAAGGYNTIDDVIIYPTDSGKYLNPLDNTLWRTNSNIESGR